MQPTGCPTKNYTLFATALQTRYNFLWDTLYMDENHDLAIAMFKAVTALKLSRDVTDT